MFLGFIWKPRLSGVVLMSTNVEKGICKNFTIKCTSIWTPNLVQFFVFFCIFLLKIGWLKISLYQTNRNVLLQMQLTRKEKRVWLEKFPLTLSLLHLIIITSRRPSTRLKFQSPIKQQEKCVWVYKIQYEPNNLIILFIKAV